MSTLVKLTRENWDTFLEMYWAGEFPHQRLGQAAVNHFSMVGQSYLFYESDSKRACEYITGLMRDYQL